MCSAVPATPDHETPAGKDGYNDNHEIEVKFTAEAAVLDEMKRRHVTAASDVQKLVSIYFDTPGGHLRRSGHTLRIRRKGDGPPTMSVKSAALAGSGPFHRREIEVHSPDGIPDLGLLSPRMRSALAADTGKQPLVKQFEVHVERTALTVSHRSSRIEMAFDTGEILGGSGSVPISELELELKSGKVSDLLDFAALLAGQAPLRLDFVSKSERGFRLVLGLQPAPAKAPPLILPHEAVVGEAIAAVAANSLAHFVANWDALRQLTDPEAIHQMRVALRRMRSALRMFRPALSKTAEPVLEKLRSSAKRIANGLGPAREYDVFLDMAEKGPLRSADSPGGGPALLAAVRVLHADAYAEARRLIDGRDVQHFVFAVQHFIAEPPGETGLQGEARGVLQTPAAKFVAKALSRLNERAVKRGSALPDLDDDARHDLRIALKNLRYCAEFSEGLFARHNKAKAFGVAISRLQDLLGAHNDVVTARRVLDGVASSPDHQAASAAAFALGWFARGVPLADDELKHAWRTFRHAPRFWK